MTDLPPPESVTTDLTGYTQAIGRIADMLQVAADAATGYRRQLEQDGWSPCIAEQLAGQALSVWQAGILR